MISNRSSITLSTTHKSIFLASFALLIFSQTASAQMSFGDDLTLEIGTSSKLVPYTQYSQWFFLSPSLSLDRAYLSEIENVDSCFQKNVLCELLLTQRNKFHTKKDVTISFEKENAKLFLAELSREFNKPPINAKFKMDNGKVSTFVADEKGLKIDLEKSLEMLADHFKDNAQMRSSSNISLPFLEVEPNIKSKDVNSLGIENLIGEGKSNFKGSTKSRIHNIRVATARYNGILLAPGEEFSFVDILGPVDGENGYLPELVIKNDKTEPEFGGGICQVSTTAFRAAIYTGLEITARKNHSYPVSYYEPHGMDAAIYVPRPDLRFKNNSPGHILIQTRIENTELIFSFYGTDDGRKITVDGPRILEKNPDGSMRTVFTQKVTDKKNQVVINETFNSYYDSPSKYPHPSTEKLSKKPKDWSKSQWDLYKKVNGL